MKLAWTVVLLALLAGLAGDAWAGSCRTVCNRYGSQTQCTTQC